jgi:PAS domain S-box-containing protein/diguanylate cyclase (GGDEF)-like protein
VVDDMTMHVPAGARAGSDPGADLSRTVDLIPAAALALDPRGTVLAANAQALAIFRTAARDLIGADIEPYLPLGDALAYDSDRASARLVGRRANGVPVVLDVSVRKLTAGGELRALCVAHELNYGALATEAQRFFDAAFDEAPIGMALFNPDGEYVRVNEALCQMLGRAQHDLIGRRDQELTHPDDRQADVDVAWEILAGDYDTHHCEKRFVRPDGSIVWALANLTFLRDEQGRPLSWVGQFEDITARRTAEAALRASEERHRLVVRNLPGAVALYDRDLRCVLMQGRHLEDAGIPSQELVGRTIAESLPPELIEAIEPAARRALAGERSAVEAFSALSNAIVTMDILPHVDDAGEIHGVLIAIRDISEQRAAEAATRDAEERFRLAFDHAPIGIALVSPEGAWLRVNKTLCDMTGYGEDELLASTFQDITHPDDLETDLAHVGAMLAGDIRTYEMEKRYIRADGSIMWVLLSVSLVRDAEGWPRYFISQIQDIDERKRAREELEHLAARDSLTGALNRRAWDDALASAIVRAFYADESLAVALIDLNNFKDVNDSLGHDSGDQLLAQAVRVWQEQLRGGDLLARIGGDEFAVLLPNCPADDLGAVVQRLKGALGYDAGCSVGTAVWSPGEQAADLMRRADAALYADKGRPAS